MDKSFNGLRYCAKQGCLVSDSGDKIRMCHGSTQVFLLLRQNVNKLVTREHLLRKVPTDGSTSHNSPDSHDDLLNECIDEIRHVVSVDRLKTIPHVGYLLTADETTADETVKMPNFRTPAPDSQARRGRAVPALIHALAFNSQWFISGYQRNPFAWTGTFVLIALLLLSSIGTTVSTTTGHMAYDRAEANACVNLFSDCAECVPSVWQTSPVFARSNWFLATACK